MRWRVPPIGLTAVPLRVRSIWNLEELNIQLDRWPERSAHLGGQDLAFFDPEVPVTLGPSLDTVIIKLVLPIAEGLEKLTMQRRVVPGHSPERKVGQIVWTKTHLLWGRWRSGSLPAG